MPFRKSLLLSLVCFTLETTNVFSTCDSSCYSSDGVSVLVNGDDGDCTYAEAVDCINSGTAGPIIFKVPNLDNLSHGPSNYTTSVDLISENSPDSSNVGTYISLQGNNDVTYIEVDTDGVVVTIGPSSSPERISWQGAGATSNLSILNGTVAFGPQCDYPPTSNSMTYIFIGDTTSSSTGTLELQSSTTTVDFLTLMYMSYGQIKLTEGVTVTYGGTLYLGGINTFSGYSMDTSELIFSSSISPPLNGVDLQNITLTLNSNTTGGGTLKIKGGANLHIAETLTLDSDTVETLSTTSIITVDQDETLTISGYVQDGGGGYPLTIGIPDSEYTGTVVLTQGSSYSGGTVLASGNVNLNSTTNYLGTGDITFYDGASLTLNNSISISENIVAETGGYITVAKGYTGDFQGDLSGSATFTFISDQASPTDPQSTVNYSGDVSGYTGTLAVNGVTYETGATTALSENMGMTLSNGATLSLGASTYSIGNLSGSDSSFVELSSGTLDIHQTSAVLSLTGVISGTGTISLIDAGYSTSLTLGSSNTYSGSTSINTNATLVIAAPDSLGNTSHLSLAGILELSSSFSDQQEIALDIALSGGDTGVDGDRVINIVRSDIGVTFSGQFTGSNGLYLQGNSTDTTLALTNSTNSYTGGTTIDGLTLTVIGLDPLGQDGQPLTFNGGVLDLVLSGDETSSSDVTLTGNGTFNVDGGTLTVLGNITGSGGLTVKGRTLFLKGINSYAKDTTISEGILQCTASSIPQNGSIVFDGGGVLILTESLISGRGFTFNSESSGVIDVDGSEVVSFTGDVSIHSGPPFLVKTGTGALSLLPTSPSVLPQLTVLVLEGTLIGNTNFLENSSFTLESGSVLAFSETGTSYYYGANHGDTISGTGTVELFTTGAFNFLVPTEGSQLYPNYLGETYLSGGTVRISADVFGNSAYACHFSGGALEVLDDITFHRGFVFDSTGFFSVDDEITLTISGDLSGAAGFTKGGAGVLSITGDSSYSGATTLQSGILNINGTLALNGSSIDVQAGTLTINGGITLSGSSTFTAEEGASFTVNGAIVGSGSLVKQGSGEVLLSSNSYVGGTTLSAGPIAFNEDGVFGHGNVTCSGGSLHSTAGSTQANNFSLDASLTEMDVDSGVSMILSGVLSGVGGIDKVGDGALLLSGASVYTGATVVEEGALIIEDTGSIDSDVTVESGATLGVNGEVNGDVTVSPNGYLKGTGTVDGSTTVYGITSGGNSIGTLYIDDTLDFENGSTLYVDVNSAEESSVIDTSGAITIDPGAHLVVLPENGEYQGIKEYTALQTASTISGEFGSVTAPPIFYMAVVADYSDNQQLTLEVTPLTITPVGAGNNAEAVADTLNDVIAWNRSYVELTLPDQAELGDAKLISLLESLYPINDTVEINTALNQMHPALFKDLVVSQEIASTQVQTGLIQHITSDVNTLDCAKSRGSYSLWLSGLGNALNQKNNWHKGSPQTGYRSTLAGFVGGADYEEDGYYVGALGGYTSSHISFHDDRGSGDVSTGYFGLYFSGVGEAFYMTLSATGGWSGYGTKRSINYTGVDEVARGEHGGREFHGMLDSGMNLPVGRFNIRPFDRVDYLTQHEYEYEEKGAGDWNLHVDKNTSIFLRNELGLIFSTCVPFNTGSLTLSPKLSWVREARIKGDTYTASFTDARDFPFTVTGYFPRRSLFSPGLSVSGTCLDDALLFSVYYEGEFVRGYSANRYGGEVRYSF